MFTRKCHRCGHAVRNSEATRIPVKDSDYSVYPEGYRYFGPTCKPDYVRVEVDRHGVEHYIREVSSTEEQLQEKLPKRKRRS